ncbi:hypothetical protein DFQ27_003769 [Actinomortierella ambigua]|uniref:DUF7905 domain-containing protein n=1 Tax=Actinomortierella ambigua TaxID=1343610 RepID=A0A9P6Q3T2_9FUNG|nr:hypothetical protein DFQ27_003769 [Actinomortierella ambigua]
MDDDDLFAQQWQQEPSTAPVDATAASPHDYWLIPTGAIADVEKELQQIHSQTGAYLHFNRIENRVDMWGNRAEIRRARDRLDGIAKMFFEDNVLKRRVNERTKFAKAERPKTPKEQRKAEQESLRLMNQFQYGQSPRDECTFTSSIMIPPHVIAVRLFGNSLGHLNNLRTELKTHAWFDSKEKVIEVAGNSAENVYKMQSRIKNVLIRNLRGVSATDTHILDKPSSMKSISFISTTPLPVYASIGSEKRGLAAQNVEKVSALLRKTLTELWIEPSEVKMKIRFGVTAFGSYPLAHNIDMKFFVENQISHLRSRFATHLLPSPSDMLEQLATALQAKLENTITFESNNVWTIDYNSPESSLHITFRDDGYPALWNAALNKTTLMDLKALSVDRHCGWCWTITAARRLLDSDSGPIKEFMEKVRLESSDHSQQLKFRNTSSVRVLSVTRKIIRPILWGDWMIELRELGRWNDDVSQGTSIKTLSTRPEHVAYTVTMYHENWKTRFSENPALDIGQRASWNPDDFIKSESGVESVEDTLEAVRRVQEIVDEVLVHGSML